ncbi:glycosyltransferase family 4 protein [Flavobacteriaceae bacterium XHP0103]|uniref:glycosyltransferase family 4 protein n=1 Tax=Marixanthotalea marina TaxID=2844359 RepID=UPI002989C673|nr:glycosyltransferase family 4 protein [Marixanthotalea marina]MBU3822727.1 glycosyltransferase family 4 protein [Marixanthotalea marina]
MNIAFLTPEYPHPKMGKSGGIGTSIFNLARALVAMGHTVYLLVYGQDSDAYFEEEGLCFCKIKNIKVKGLSLYLTQKKVERLINELHKAKKVDIVEAPDWTGFTAFVNSTCPLVIRQNGSDTYFCYLEQRPVKFKNRFLEKRALKKADALISVSQFTGNLTNALFNLDRDFKVIPNSIDVGLFNSNDNNESNKLNILYFGTLIRKKGLLELPAIFNLVHESNKQVILTLVGADSADIKTGSPSTWQLMQPLFTESALKQVRYLGSVTYDDMQAHIKLATVCVFPSFAEALPVSWLEAMAMEKAIVASNIGWATEVIDDGMEGYLVHPTNHEQYANGILELLSDANKRQQFGRAAREKVKTTFSMEVVAGQSVAFYKQLIK